MDVIDFELKRYESMQTDLENFKKSFDNLSTSPKDQSKSVDDLDTLMNEEKPKEVKKNPNHLISACDMKKKFIQSKNAHNFSFHLDGTTTSTNSRVKATTKVGKLVETNDEHDFIAASKS